MPCEVFNSQIVRRIWIIFVYVLKYSFRKKCVRTSSGVLHVLIKIKSVAVIDQELDFNFCCSAAVNSI